MNRPHSTPSCQAKGRHHNWRETDSAVSTRIDLAKLAFLLLGPATVGLRGAAIPDLPFWQDTAVRIHHAPELTNAIFRKVLVDKENVVYVLTDKGVARIYDDNLALDKSFRPLAGKI